MFWRHHHPLRGPLAFLLVFGLSAFLMGFEMGIPEFALLGILSGVAFLVGASRESSSD